MEEQIGALLHEGVIPFWRIENGEWRNEENRI